MTRNKIIYCYLNDIFHGCRYLGNLYVQNERGREIYSFEWSNECLEQEVPFPILDPRLFAGMYGRQYAGDRLFGVFSDACPDCWGRLLMSRGGKEYVRDRRSAVPLSFWRAISSSAYTRRPYGGIAIPTGHKRPLSC